jgi:serine/threonine protein kinase HipA of HipAB toxin-antitoxin module
VSRRLSDARLFDARGADRPALRHGHADVVAAEVGEELRVGEELVRRPAGVEHAELREPLRDEEVIADHAGAIEVLREAPFQLTRSRSVWPGWIASTSVAAASDRSSAFWSSGEMKRSVLRQVEPSLPSALTMVIFVTS